MRNTKNYKELPYNPNLLGLAKKLRKAGMLHEVLLWLELKNSKLNGLDFDRQKVIGDHIVDFYCAEKEVVIEADGISHDNPKKSLEDEERDAYLESLELTVIRILAKDILENREGVICYLRNHPAFAVSEDEG